MRREGGCVEGLPEGLADSVGVPLERVPTHGWVHAEERLDVLLIEEVADVPERASGDRVTGQ